MQLTQRLLRYFGLLCLVTMAPLSPSDATAGLIGPTAYVQASDSPFDGVSFDYFHLEDFEDSLLDVPGVTSTTGGAPLKGSGDNDSVDADDGSIDGSGSNGGSFFLFAGIGNTATLTFEFSAAVLGTLPTHVGIVWVDGTGSITFEAFGSGGASLGTIVGTHADGSIKGTTAEDRFYGVIDAGGISKITIQNLDGIEVDHLQFGALTSVPEPSTFAIFAVGCVGLIIRRKRRCRPTLP